MTTTADKVAYVKSQEQTRTHACHWPGCDQQVPPAMFACRPHWFKLPKWIRNLIWQAYQPGQERTGRPSEAYVHAANLAQEWIAALPPPPPPPPPIPVTLDLFDAKT